MAKPVVDRLERDLAGEAAVIRVDILSRTGRSAALAHSIRAMPTLLVFDGCGREVHRQVGLIQGGRVIEAVRSVEACTPPVGGG